MDLVLDAVDPAEAALVLGAISAFYTDDRERTAGCTEDGHLFGVQIPVDVDPKEGGRQVDDPGTEWWTPLRAEFGGGFSWVTLLDAARGADRQYFHFRLDGETSKHFIVGEGLLDRAVEVLIDGRIFVVGDRLFFFPCEGPALSFHADLSEFAECPGAGEDFVAAVSDGKIFYVANNDGELASYAPSAGGEDLVQTSPAIGHSVNCEADGRRSEDFALDADGRLWLAEDTTWSAGRVRVFAPGLTESWTFDARDAPLGFAPCVHAFRGRVYVRDFENGRIFSPRLVVRGEAASSSE